MTNLVEFVSYNYFKNKQVQIYKDGCLTEVKFNKIYGYKTYFSYVYFHKFKLNINKWQTLIYAENRKRNLIIDNNYKALTVGELINVLLKLDKNAEIQIRDYNYGDGDVLSMIQKTYTDNCNVSKGSLDDKLVYVFSGSC